jgi:hypothetical protein
VRATKARNANPARRDVERHRIFDGERGNGALVPSVQIGIGGLQSLLENWGSITLSLEQLQDYLDDLRLVRQIDRIPRSESCEDT